MKKNKLWIPILAAVLIVAVIAGVILVPRLPKEEAAVYPVTMVGYTNYYAGSAESYGLVTTDKVQSLYLSGTQTVTEIMVYPGQTVQKGDVLFTYDTTLSDLAIERKDLANQQLEVELKTAQAELTALKKLKPMQITAGSTSDTKDDTDYSKSPSSKDKLNTEYSGNHGRNRLYPFYFWLGYGQDITDEMIAELFKLAEERNTSTTAIKAIYVVFQSVKSNAINTAFTETHNLRIERTTETITIPVSGSQSAAAAAAAQTTAEEAPSTEPVTQEEPGEVETPTEEEIPGQEDPTEESTEATEPTVTEPEVTEPTEPTETEPTEPPATEPPVETVSTTVTRYDISFFSLTSSSEKDNDGSVIWNSGYTSAELTAMKNEKQAEIKQLQFDIKVGKAELSIMKKEASDGQVVAEFNGVVSEILEPATALETSEPLMKVTGGGGYYVEGSVSELALDTLTVGQSVTVTSWDTGMVYTGKVVEVGSYPVEDEGYSYYGTTNVTYYPYKVFIDESADLKEGFYVSMTYQTAEQAAGILYLQNAFIRADGNRSYVLVRNADGLLEKRYLECGVSTDGYMTPIYSGITEEDYLAFPYGSAVVEGAPTYEGTDQDLYGY